MSSKKAYPATIESIAVHPNADKLKLANILGYQIIVGLDAQVGQSGWLYLPDAIIKEEAVKYFSLDYLSKGRVRQVKLRGEYSDGLFINTSTMLMENPFDMDAIWEEYIPVTKYKGEPNNKAAKKQNIIAKVFPKHMDTQQYLANKAVIEKLVNDGWNISYSVKTHGTCLQAQSRVRMWDGSIKAIKDIVVGDIVQSKDGLTTVTDTFNYPNIDNWMQLKFDNISVGDKNVLKCTVDHRLWTDKGWVEAQEVTEDTNVMISTMQLYPTDLQKDIHEGKLWGDGHYNTSKSLEYAHKVGHAEYIEHCMKAFGNLHKSLTNKTSGYGTNMLAALNKVSRFLPNKASYLNPQVIAVWYMDDGSLSHSDVQADRANLAVCRYSLEECTKIVNLFNDVNLYPTLYTDKDGYNRLRFNKDTANDLFEMIAPYIPPVMQYKLPVEYRDKFIEIEYQIALPALYTEYRKPVSIATWKPNRSKNKRRYDITTTTHSFIANNVVVHNSGRSAYVFKPVIPPVTFMEKAILKVSSWFRMYTKYMDYLEKKYEHVVETYPDYLTGSRNVIFSGDNTSTLREGFTDILAPSMEVGMIMYYEILGWESPEKPIMEPYKGKPYDYGIPKGDAGIQVYRITKHGVDLTLKEMHEYCDTYGIPYVKQIFADSPEEAFQHSIVPITCEVLLTSNDVWTYRYDHTNEGLVIRLDNPITKEVKLFKYKNREFLIQEGVLPQQSDE